MKNLKWLAMASMVILMVWGCSEEKTPQEELLSAEHLKLESKHQTEIILEERSESLQSLLDEGYEVLTVLHPAYERLMAAAEGVDKNSASARLQSCGWRGRPSFTCSSTGGGQCMILVLTGPAPYRACVICVGGPNDGNADCI